MKANMKRIAGAGALAVAMMANMSFAAFAADTKVSMEKLIPATAAYKTATEFKAGEGAQAFAKVGMVKFDEETGKMLCSEDEGKTWKEMDVEVMPAAKLTEAVASEGASGAEGDSDAEGDTIAAATIEATTIMTKLDEETGKMRYSEDEGKTWQEADFTQEMMMTMVKTDEETGKTMISMDGGKTWEAYDGKAVELTESVPASEIAQDGADH